MAVTELAPWARHARFRPRLPSGRPQAPQDSGDVFGGGARLRERCGARARPGPAPPARGGCRGSAATMPGLRGPRGPWRTARQPSPAGPGPRPWPGGRSCTGRPARLGVCGESWDGLPPAPPSPGRAARGARRAHGMRTRGPTTPLARAACEEPGSWRRTRPGGSAREPPGAKRRPRLGPAARRRTRTDHSWSRPHLPGSPGRAGPPPGHHRGLSIGPPAGRRAGPGAVRQPPGQDRRTGRAWPRRARLQWWLRHEGMGPAWVLVA